MIVYWILVLIPALAAFGEKLSRTNEKKKVFLFMFLSILFIIMAFRTVGGDFEIYNMMFEYLLKGQPLSVYIESTEPIYGLLNWISSQLDWHIYGVNAFCALIFLYCLYRVIIQERLPILFLAISVTYFVIVVGIGYTRQGVAIALVMLAVSYLRKERIYHFIVVVLIAGGFHSSALIVFPLLLVSKRRFKSNFFATISRGLIVIVGIYAISKIMSTQADEYFKLYVSDDHYKSDGALLRSLVSAAAGIMFLIYKQQWNKVYGDFSLWRPFALISILFVPLSVVASTSVDRMGLYLLPFQLLTFTRIPTFQRSESNLMMMKSLIIVGYIFYFYIWLHHGTYAQELWTPYSWGFSVSFL